MIREDLLQQAIDYLAWLKSRVELRNSIRLMDINIMAEDFFCGLLNLVYGYSLVNINIEERDTAAIDLGDEDAKIAIQVTSTKDFKKIKETFQSFMKHGLHSQYDRLVVLNIREKSTHRVKKIGSDGGFQMDTELDVWDTNDIVKKIRSITDMARLRDIAFYLNENLSIRHGESLANEVLTILRLVELLGEGRYERGGKAFEDKPDPKRKIFDRFVNKSEYLVKSYTDLFPHFGGLMKDVRARSELPETKIELMQFHLKEESDRVLTDCGGDPHVAITRLQDHYGGLLRERGIAHNSQAVRFFLVDQLMRCNVFPQEMSVG
ncbi:SMEK domain-containing protein [Rhizobium hidalgonense]|uniref:SMEK domain-containing protein n=1 Tax=Rhizobium hidalgonense TaxID=1538159 RepID=UPI002870E4F5|nr:SMEK domain-containing protein [Rhizobium hidalgonense]MDR9807960.1 SMEK domain-containing protein [Rhizobium hidalgonense]